MSVLKFKQRMKLVAKLMDEAAVYIPFNCEAVRITGCDYNSYRMFGVGEESGKGITVEFEDVNLDNDMFYKLSLMENTF